MGLGNNIDDLFLDIDTPQTANVPKINNKLVYTIPDNLVIISGCKDNQTSADAYIGGRYQGALSYAIQSSLIRNLSINYDQLHNEVCRTLHRKRFTQEPNLIGSDVSVPFLT
jgi:hypothetical protein